jgi:hypothetical protein
MTDFLVTSTQYIIPSYMGKTRVDKAVCTNSPPELTNQLLLILRLFFFATYRNKNKKILTSKLDLRQRENGICTNIYCIHTQTRRYVHTVCTQKYKLRCSL